MSSSSLSSIATRKDLALDSEYRDRFVEFHMYDGEILNSQVINWRHVKWNEVIKLRMYMRGRWYEVDCKDKPTFKFFMNYRWAGVTWDTVNGELKRRKINSWAIGWSDGKRQFCKEVDFQTGDLVREYEGELLPDSENIHPMVKKMFEGAK